MNGRYRIETKAERYAAADVTVQHRRVAQLFVGIKINSGERCMMSIGKNALLAIFLCSVMGFISITGARAAESGNPEKRQLFERLMLVTDMQARYSQIIEIMVNQVGMVLQANVRQTIEKMEKATPEQKKKFGQIMEDAMGRLTGKMTAAMKQELPFAELVDRVYYPLYDRHFTASDLESVLQFYESPVGKKFVSSTPVIMQESVSLFNELYTQKLQKVGQTVAEEELKRIKQELEKIPKE